MTAPHRLAFLSLHPFAHRGLHGHGIVENSPSAFAAAIAAGHGIELDVQLSGDGQAIVFHDDELDRLTGQSGRLATMSAADLGAVTLTGTTDTIPTLAQTLAQIAGRAPLLIEIKTQGRKCAPLCAAVRRDLVDYTGPVAVMGFNPGVSRWFRRHAPHIVHGLVITEEGPEGWREKLLKAGERFAAIAIARPDFLAYDIRALDRPLPRRMRASGMPVLSWTVRAPEQRERAAHHADQIIYETP